MINRARAGKAGAMELEHEWAVILAGGEGTRLKSLSRKITGDERPKQFCPVFGDMTLLEETQGRVAIELAKERTLFVVNRHHEPYEAGPRIHEKIQKVVGRLNPGDIVNVKILRGGAQLELSSRKNP